MTNEVDERERPPPYRFRCMGPYAFPYSRAPDGTKIVERLAARDRVFAAAEKDAERIGIRDIRESIGLYVMALSPAGGSVTWPYYVGQAAQQTLYERTFQKTDKPRIYSSILNKWYERARPLMYLFPLVTAAGNQVKPPSKTSRINKLIDNAEYMLIGNAMHANPGLWNVRDRIGLDQFKIDGTPQVSLRETKDARRFRTMMGFAVSAKDVERVEQQIQAGIDAAVDDDAVQQALRDADTFRSAPSARPPDRARRGPEPPR